MWPFDSTAKKEKLEDLQKHVRQNAELYKRVFANPDGEAVLKDLAKRSCVNRTTYDPDTKKMCIQEGRRSLFVYISNLVNKDVETILSELKGER